MGIAKSKAWSASVWKKEGGNGAEFIRPSGSAEPLLSARSSPGENGQGKFDESRGVQADG